MTQETAKVVIDRLQGEAGYATGGEVDRLVFSGLDVHEMLNEIEQAFDTDKLSVEKLQEHLLPYKKEMVQKIIDEKMQLVTADEFLKLHKESLTAIRENDKLQEQLNTAKMALTEIASSRQEIYRGGTSVGLELTEDAKIAFDALAEIGGDDDENRL